MPRLGVNIDHVATLRQARRESFPSPVKAAIEARSGGADSITIHLREDRRHIQDADLPAIQKAVRIPVNLEMALHPEIVKIALRYAPEKVCMVPERRQELTTEGGLDAVSARGKLIKVISQLKKKKIQVSLFIDADFEQVRTAAEVGANAIEIHTGTYAAVRGAKRRKELKRIRAAAELAVRLGLKVHAGHGLDYENVKPLLRIPEIEEYNIGFSIVGEAVFTGLRSAVRRMKSLIR